MRRRKKMELRREQLEAEFDGCTLDHAVKQTYAIAGLALYQSQCFERGLLVLGLLPCAARAPGADELLQLERDLSELTLGKLFTRFLGEYSSELTLVNLLRDAVKRRNLLCHGFFFSQPSLISVDAARAAAQVLIEHWQAFEKADFALRRIAVARLTELGLSVDDLDRVVLAAEQRLASQRLADEIAGLGYALGPDEAGTCD